MKKYILPILLSAFLMVPFNMSGESRSNYHRGQNKTEKSSGGHHQGGNRPGNSGNHRPGNNKGDNNRPGNKNDKKGHDKGHGNNHNNGNHWNGNSNHRPGGGQSNPMVKPGKPNHKPGHSGSSWRLGNSVNAPGHNYRPHHHPPKLGYMVNHAIRGGRYDNVWLVGPGQYAVRFYRNGRYYMQYIWPEIGRYGTPFRIVMSSPGQWYAYDNRNQWYYDDGNSLRISVNGSYLNPWTLVPAIELNINL